MDNLIGYSEEKYIRNIKKVYPHMITIKIYNEPLHIRSRLIRTGKREMKEDFIPDDRSIRRTRDLIRDYIVCNKFEWFFTWTFDPKKVENVQDFTHCYSLMKKWINSQRTNHSPALKYLIVPERHKSGAIHFHGLMSNYHGKMRDSGHKYNNRVVYNCLSWRYGSLLGLLTLKKSKTSKILLIVIL